MKDIILLHYCIFIESFLFIIIICDRVRGNQPYAIKIDFEIRAP